MGKGRNSKPVEIKQIEGTSRSDRSSMNSMVPERIDGLPEAPSVLINGAKKIWDDTVKDLQKINMLYGLDLNFLASYCDLMASFFAQKRLINNEGYLIKNRFDEKVVNPRVKLSFDTLDRALKIGIQFGFTPSSRVKINAPPVKEMNSKLDSIMKKLRKN